MDGKLLLTIDEAAALLSCGRSFLYPRLMRGELPSVKLGRKRLIPAAALEAYVQRLQAEQDDGL